MLGILSFVMLTHFLVEKCINYWSIEVSDTVVDVESQETDEHRSIFDFYSVLNYIFIISFIYFLRFSLQYYLLSPRMSLLLKDAEIVLEFVCYSKLLFQKSSAKTLHLEGSSEKIKSAARK